MGADSSNHNPGKAFIEIPTFQCAHEHSFCFNADLTEFQIFAETNKFSGINL